MTELATEVEKYPWYHTLELGNGVVTKGMFDHRPVLSRYPIPADLTGKRCLDVATMDGYWAFEMERRGAASVTALDLEDPDGAGLARLAARPPRQDDGRDQGDALRTSPRRRWAPTSSACCCPPTT